MYFDGSTSSSSAFLWKRGLQFVDAFAINNLKLLDGVVESRILDEHFCKS